MVSVDYLVPGMILNQTVHSPDGKITLGQGTVLTKSWIDKLAAWGINKVTIGENPVSLIDEDELQNLLKAVLEDAVQQKSAAQIAQENFMLIHEEAIVTLRRKFLWTRCSGKSAPLYEFYRLAEILYQHTANPDTFLLLHNDARVENYLYQHSVDVALLAGMLGRWLGFAEEQVKELVFAGLVHDIGKARIQYELLTKPAALSSQEKKAVQEHSRHSEQLLQQAQCSEVIITAVGQHHERINGEGYPLGLSGSAIHPYARILAVADVYDALTSDRCYKKGVTPLEAAEIMISEMEHQFDSRIFHCLLEKIRHCLLGGKILLNNGIKGEIVFFPSLPAMRPIIKSAEGTVIDLSADRDLRIMKLVVNR